MILIGSECFDLEFIQKCFLDEIGSGRAGHHAQEEGNEHDLDGMDSLTILLKTGSVHGRTEIYVKKELACQTRVFIL